MGAGAEEGAVLVNLVLPLLVPVAPTVASTTSNVLISIGLSPTTFAPAPWLRHCGSSSSVQRLNGSVVLHGALERLCLWASMALETPVTPVSVV